jgi:hypothetical protein
MAKTNGQDSQSVNGEFNLIRWKVCFVKCNQCSSDLTETEETFTSLEKAIKFANDLGHLDLREKYFGDKLIYPANIRIVEVGRYKKEIPWESWCALAPSIDKSIKELDGQPKFKVWYTTFRDWGFEDVAIEYDSFTTAKDAANKLYKENSCYPYALVKCGELKTNIRIEQVGTTSRFLDTSEWLVNTSGIPRDTDIPDKYKKDGMHFEVEHSRVPKDGCQLPLNTMFMTDKFTRFDNARNFARCLLRREPNHPYIREASKNYWFFNINVFSVENGVRTLIPVEDWQDPYSNGTEELSNVLDYCSEVAGIKGERDMFKEEVDRLKSELDEAHAEIKRLKQIISASATMLESQMNALAGLTEE